METKFNELSQVQRSVELFLANDELQPHFDKAYREAQPKIDLKGFRKGKVPINVIKQMFGRELEANALEDIASETFTKIVQDEKLHVVGQPRLKDIDKTPEGIRFFIEFDIMPDFEPADYRGLTIDEPVHKVTDEEIEHELLHIGIHNGTLHPADQITGDLFVATLHMTEIDTASNLPLIGGKNHDTSVFLHDHSVIPELRQLLLNTKVGDTFRFKPSDYDRNADPATFEVTVTKIEELVPAEITNDFVENYTKGKFTTTEELREEIGFQLQESWEQKSRSMMEDQIIGKLIEMNEFEIPQSVVRQVLDQMAEDMRKKYANVPGVEKITTDSIADDLRPVAEKRVKWEIIRARILDKEKIEVEDFDIDDLAETEAARMNADKATVRRAIANNPNVREMILSKKLMDLIFDFAITNEVPFDGDDERFDDHDHEHDHDHDKEH